MFGEWRVTIFRNKKPPPPRGQPFSGIKSPSPSEGATIPGIIPPPENHDFQKSSSDLLT